MFVEWITALQIVVETGLIGRQANGAVTVTDGETVCQILQSRVCKQGTWSSLVFLKAYIPVSSIEFKTVKGAS